MKAAFSRPLFFHALIYPSAERHNIREHVREYITGPGGGTLLSWLDAFRDPYGAVTRATTRKMVGQCHVFHMPLFDGGRLYFGGSEINFPLELGRLEISDRIHFQDSFPWYDEKTCNDENHETPCDLTSGFPSTWMEPLMNRSNWSTRRVLVAKPGTSQVCSLESNGSIYGCSLDSFKTELGLDESTLLMLNRFLKGDPLSEIDAGGIFRYRCPYPDDETFDCRGTSVLDIPVIGEPFYLVMWTPWSRLDQFERLTPLTEKEKEKPSNAPIYLFVSGTTGVRAFRIPRNDPSSATEIWAYVPYVVLRYAFVDSLPGSVRFLPPSLSGWGLSA